MPSSMSTRPVRSNRSIVRASGSTVNDPRRIPPPSEHSDPKFSCAPVSRSAMTLSFSARVDLIYKGSLWGHESGCRSPPVARSINPSDAQDAQVSAITGRLSGDCRRTGRRSGGSHVGGEPVTGQ
ncbi:hypothetical protein RHCRD62_20629 [Rhodococcus sp. RD6.2]|nr:hypothetical protein RHCRD62_20629 [Rhodococcus sp. RD6.2]